MPQKTDTGSSKLDEAEQPRPWRTTFDEVADGLLDLIASQPQLADRIGPLTRQLLRLRGQFEAIERGRTLVLPLDDPGSRAEAIMRLVAPREPAAPKLYRIDDRNLKEATRSEHGEATLQVGYDDYVRVAAALAALGGAATGRGERRPGATARRLMSQTGRVAATDSIGKRQVALTHVYICLRFWQREGIIERPQRGEFRPADPGRPFTEVAVEAWERLAAGPARARARD